MRVNGIFCTAMMKCCWPDEATKRYQRRAVGQSSLQAMGLRSFSSERKSHHPRYRRSIALRSLRTRISESVLLTAFCAPWPSTKVSHGKRSSTPFDLPWSSQPGRHAAFIWIGEGACGTGPLFRIICVLRGSFRRSNEGVSVPPRLLQVQALACVFSAAPVLHTICEFAR